MKLDKRQMLVCNVYRPPDAKVARVDGRNGCDD